MTTTYLLKSSNISILVMKTRFQYRQCWCSYLLLKNIWEFETFEQFSWFLSLCACLYVVHFAFEKEPARFETQRQ